MINIYNRYLVTLILTLLRAIIGFVSGILLARYFGAVNYGKLTFLVGIFLSIRALLDLGASQAFFTFMSNEKRTKKFVNVYFLWLLFQLIIFGIFIILLPINWAQNIWHENNKVLIFFAFSAIFLQNSVWPSIQQALESQRSSIQGQIIGVSVAFIHFVLILVLSALNLLSIFIVFAVITLEYLVAFNIAYRFIKFSDLNIESENLYKILCKYWRYCKPIVFYSIISFFYSFFDTWFLQSFAGNVNQAHYSISTQLSSMTLLITISLSNIFFKEIAEAFYNGDNEKVIRIYLKVIRVLFVMSAFLACFFVPWAEDILFLLLGKSFSSGYLTLSIMLIYPIHQSIGQICGNVLFATNNVLLHTKIGLTFMIASVFFSYLLLAPSNFFIPGFNLGSYGLAIKMFSLQFLQVNIMMYFIAKMFNIRFDITFQFVILVLLICISFFSYTIIRLLIPVDIVVLRMLIGFVIYALSFFCCLLFFPRIVGFQKGELLSSLRIFLVQFNLYKV